MPDDPTPTPAAAPAATNPAPATDPAPADPPADPADPGDAPTAATPEEIAALRREAGGYRKQLRAAQEELKKLQDAQLSEQERIAKRATEAEAALQTMGQRARDALLRASVTSEAVKAGITDPDAARLLLPSVGQVEYDEETGEPLNVADLVKQLAEAKPYLLGQVDDPAPTRPAAGRQPAAPAAQRRGATITRDQLRAMRPDDVAEYMRTHPGEVERVLADTGP